MYHCDTDQQACSPGELGVPSADNYRYKTLQTSKPPKFYSETCEFCTKGVASAAYTTVNASADFFCWDPDYNKWAYGMDGITDDGNHGYFETDWDKDFQVQQYAFRDVWYLSGVDDQCSPAMKWYNTSNPKAVSKADDLDNLGPYDTDCNYHSIDTRCPAMLEGPWREYRATHYVAYLTKYFGQKTHTLVSWISNSNFNLVPGVGHDGGGMLTSTEGTAAIYTRTSQESVLTQDLGW